MSRPVREGRDLDRYLVGDGLDASTVISDFGKFTEELGRFRWNVPEYTEYLDGYPEPSRSQRQPDQLIPSLREGLRARAEQLGASTCSRNAVISASFALITARSAATSFGTGGTSGTNHT